ncbi:hypothetical protein [uncultured Roseivirga sp.]|uniref:hypothetical protein n=1 Tax=uncultured Roseivirga sp. TaxID=543088 RepID=UPI000D798F14|nr:hypothetical protein [uncultured Roseivirga sp.]PWL31959.1 MAG: hypothetical protein DCO95_01905 [Roseivirga sp. XM-24bin3]
MLKELGIVIGNETKAGKIFEELFPDFMTIEYDKPSNYVSYFWNKYELLDNRNPNLNGKVFEYILASLCIRENILPLYLSAKVAFVPNVIYDLMFYTKERGPICWSVKTSLRERYKQADLESIALKYVHRKALSYLITLSNEAIGVKAKIKSGDVIGLDNVIIATSPEFDELVTNLKAFQFEEPPIVKVIESTQVVTMEKVHSVYGV